MFPNLDSKCGSNSRLREISYFDAGVSIALALSSTPVNLLILTAIVRYKHLLHRSFYLIIGNIAVADFIAALFVDSLSINFHIKEGLLADITPLETQAMHYLFFVTNTVSVLSMTLLSVDRLGVLLNPFFYYSQMTRMRTIGLISLTWVVAVALSSLYFKLGYIRFNAIFATTTVSITMAVMIATMLLFQRRLRQSELYEKRVKDSINNPTTSQQRTLHTFTQMDKRITKTFLWMLVLYLINYVPVLVLVTYMNLCEECDCNFIHVMRDFLFLSIISSGLWRALNFILRLTSLRDAIKSIFVKKTTSSNNNNNNNNNNAAYANAF